MKVLFVTLAAVISAVSVVACGSDTPSTATSAPAAVRTSTSVPKATTSVVRRMLQAGDKPAAPSGALDTSKSYTATFKTEKGDFKVELFDDQAPLTVENFVNLARIGYYDNTTFHRVLSEFMAQGGDPTATGSGGPGYRFKDEFAESLTFDAAGILAMANSGPATNGSQFFITFAPTPWLNNAHTIFGKVTEGTEVAMAIELRDPGTATKPGQKLLTVLIEEK